MKKRVLMTWFVLLALAAGGGHAQQGYPERPVRLIVPFPGGGQTDVVARALSNELSVNFGQQVVVDNRPGAAGTIGVDLAARATNDGYTMAMVSTSYAANVSLYKLGYDPVTDISPVVMIGEIANLVMVNSASPFKTVKQLIDYAKANPNKLNYASGGRGSGNHLATELLLQMTGAKMTHVPYKGSTSGLPDLMGGNIELIVGGITSLLPHHKAGRARAIAVTSAKRNPAAPDLPAVAETVRGYEAVSWAAILGPKGVPAGIVKRWNAEMNKVLKTPSVKKRLDTTGLETVGGTPEQFRKILISDIAKWRKVVKDANITR